MYWSAVHETPLTVIVFAVASTVPVKVVNFIPTWNPLNSSLYHDFPESVKVLAVAATVAPISNPPPADFKHNLLPYTIYPIQAAWESDKDGDGIIDLVSGKPVAVLVNAPDYVGAPLELLGDGNWLADATWASNGIAAFYMTLDNTAYGVSVRNVQLSVNQEEGIIGTPRTVTVRNTRDLALYWGHMQDAHGYTVPTQTQFEDFINVSSGFIESVYPVKTVFDSFNDSEGNLDPFIYRYI